MNTNQLDTPLLDASGIAKSYGAVRALSEAHLRVNAGQIVALMGANGAGKSTLIKVLTGAIRPDRGRVLIRGQEVRVGSPAQARRSGLIPVYQEPSLIPDLDVADNLRLTSTPSEPFFHWVSELGISGVRPTDLVGPLPLATLRILDLARALANEPDLLLLDELTAALPTDLVAKVLEVVREQARAGRGIIYVSHRFSEISELCDDASILRDGKTVGELKVEPGIEERAVELMLGEKIDLGRRRLKKSHDAAPLSAPRLVVQGLSVAHKLSDVSFTLHKGEVLGVVGLEGQGQDELFHALAGVISPDAGTIELEGQVQQFKHPADAIAAGVKFVPGDRASALCAERSVHENLALPFSASPRNWGPLRLGHEKSRVELAIERLQIDRRVKGEVRRLSGGNQQKVTIGRWIATGIDTLLLFDPTRGIDVKTKRQIYPLVRELAQEGASILYYTSEFEEIPLACDRVATIFNGQIVDIIDAADADEQTLMRLAYGLKSTAGSPA